MCVCGNKRELLALIELFCVLIVMVVHKYKGVNIHRTIHQKENHQTISVTK